MDFHLDNLLNLPHITVVSCQQQEGFIILILDFLNEGILCPLCQTYTDHLHQTRPILVRDLSNLGQTAKTILKYIDEICNYFINGTTSGVMEGLNNKIKLILRQSYGFKNFDLMREKLLACLFL